MADEPKMTPEAQAAIAAARQAAPSVPVGAKAPEVVPTAEVEPGEFAKPGNTAEFDHGGVKIKITTN